MDQQQKEAAGEGQDRQRNVSGEECKMVFCFFAEHVENVGGLTGTYLEFCPYRG